VLISLGVILAIAASVSAEANNARASIFSSANDQASVSGRESASARTTTYTHFENYQSSGHECGSFADPNAD
jgi:hypothetical protein